MQLQLVFYTSLTIGHSKQKDSSLIQCNKSTVHVPVVVTAQNQDTGWDLHVLVYRMYIQCNNYGNEEFEQILCCLEAHDTALCTYLEAFLKFLY